MLREGLMKRDILWLSCLLVLCVAVFCVQHAFKKSVRSAPVAASVFDHQQSSDKEISNEISEAIEGFCKKWSPPSATKGYGWDYKGAWTSLRNTLSRHKRKELVIAELLRWLEKPNLDAMLRDIMAQMIFTINKLEQKRIYTRLYNSPKNSAKVLGLMGLARLQLQGDAELQHAISLTLGQTKWPSVSELDNIKTGIRGIRSYFGRTVSLQIPSEYWRVTWTDHPQDSEYLLLAKDIKAWWEKNKSYFEGN